MISRYPIVCPGCDTPFLVRLGVTPSKMTRFYVPCPTCHLPIRGRSHGEELETHRVEFDAERFSNKDEPQLIVTVDPHVPSRYEATEMLNGLGSAPNLALLWLIGDDLANDFFMYLSRGQYAVEGWWPKVRRVYEYYLAEDWERFNLAGRVLLKDRWPDPVTTHERATYAHQVLGIALGALVDDEWPASAKFLNRWAHKHAAAVDRPVYRAFAKVDADSGTVATLQRRIFDVLDLFVQRFDSWQMGMLRRLIPDENLPLLDDLRLFRDEFDILRDLYQQAFETICKTLRYPVAAQNTVKHSNPNHFGTVVPSTLTRKANPANLAAFEKLSNFEKLQYVREIPGCAGWVSLLDNKTRNAIGHATVRHDLRTGLVISDNVPNGVPYLDVVADVYGIFDALSVSAQIVRGIRVVSSPDFKTQSDAEYAALQAVLGMGALRTHNDRFHAHQ